MVSRISSRLSVNVLEESKRIRENDLKLRETPKKGTFEWVGVCFGKLSSINLGRALSHSKG